MMVELHCLFICSVTWVVFREAPKVPFAGVVPTG